jgi:ADP-ribose pyrophosphatase
MNNRSSKCVYQGKRFAVEVVEVLSRDNQMIEREMVVHPGAVVILPLLDEKNIVLIRNQRFAVGQTLWELPAGTREANEEPQVTAARELIEETGYRAHQISHLTTFYTTPGFCNEKMDAYVAKDLTFVGQKLEETEKIQVDIKPWNEVMKMIESGEICDAKTLTTLLYYFSRY